jgi:hypothetical protein
MKSFWEEKGCPWTLYKERGKGKYSLAHNDGRTVTFETALEHKVVLAFFVLLTDKYYWWEIETLLAWIYDIDEHGFVFVAEYLGLTRDEAPVDQLVSELTEDADDIEYRHLIQRSTENR